MPGVGTAARAVAVLVTASVTVLSFLAPAWASPLKSQVSAGYQATGEPFTRVAATWKVPPVACTGVSAKGDSDSYVWVGLGSGPSDSERVGVREFCTGILPAYVAFIEMSRLYEVQGIDPSPGDAISASVTFASGKYRFFLADSTQHKSFSLKYSCGAFSFGQGTCSRATAAVGTGIWAPHASLLADYGRVSFASIAITDARGRHGSFAESQHWRTAAFSEIAGNRLAALPSSLSHRGTRFTDTWRHL
jgi:Peptidase A4 family